MPEEVRGRGRGAIARALERLGLGRRELAAWAFYDWANSAFFTVVVTAVFPVYYRQVAAAGRADVLETYGLVTSAALFGIAVVGPLLGALADASAKKKRYLGAFAFLGCAATAGLFFVGRGDWLAACALFALGRVGVAGSLVFYDALLPSIARDDELDRVSSAGFALGYLGGGLILALDVALILSPTSFGLHVVQWLIEPNALGLPAAGTLPARVAFLSVAAWWIAFSTPLFRIVREPARRFEADERPGESPLLTALTRVVETLRELRRYRHAFLLLVAFLIYSDGISTIIGMAVIYGGALEIDSGSMILAVLAVQLVGVPCALAFGWLAGRIGAKRAILCGLAGYAVVTLLAWRLRTAADFYVLAVGVGVVQGGCQALSRSLFASMVPRHKAGEWFGVFGVLDRFASVLGPLAMTAAIRATGETRAGVLPLLVFFGAGALVLAFVDVEAGRRAAREADLATRAAR